jgi:hypothetical protein
VSYSEAPVPLGRQGRPSCSRTSSNRQRSPRKARTQRFLAAAYSFAPLRSVAPAFTSGSYGPLRGSASRQVSVRRGDHKLIRTRHQSGLGIFDTYELYDLARNPAETINLWFSRPVLGHSLRLRLEAQDLSDFDAKTSDRKEDEPVDPEMLNRLRALGYSD